MTDPVPMRWVRHYGGYSDQNGHDVPLCGSCGIALGDQFNDSWAFHKKFTIDYFVNLGKPNAYSEYRPASWSYEDWNPPPRPEDSYEYASFAFCPWCGVKFEDEWMVHANRGLSENAQPIDHSKNPGHHNGDSHVFPGFLPSNHWLATTGDELCWCDYTVDSTLTECVVTHADSDYEAYLEVSRIAYESQGGSDDD